jgi:hypothetical protein
MKKLLVISWRHEGFLKCDQEINGWTSETHAPEQDEGQLSLQISSLSCQYYSVNL